MASNQQVIEVGNKEEQLIVNVYQAEVTIRQKYATDEGARDEYMNIDRALFDEIVKQYLEQQSK
jgi:hypothetical protein